MSKNFLLQMLKSCLVIKMKYFDDLGYLRVAKYNGRNSKNESDRNDGQTIFIIKYGGNGGGGLINIRNLNLGTRKWLIGKRVRIRLELIGDLFDQKDVVKEDLPDIKIENTI